MLILAQSGLKLSSIILGFIGGLVLLAVLIIILVVLKKRRKAAQAEEPAETPAAVPAAAPNAAPAGVPYIIPKPVFPSAFLYEHANATVMDAAPVVAGTPEPEPAPEPVFVPVMAPAAEEVAAVEEDIYIGEAEDDTIRYNRSFTARLMQSDDILKARYSEIKNELLSYKKARARLSWKFEAFYVGRQCVAKLLIRGKTLRMYIAVNPLNYDEKLGLKTVDLASFDATPAFLPLKSTRKMKIAKNLVADAMAGVEAKRIEKEVEDFSKIPYHSTKWLLKEGLIKTSLHHRRTNEFFNRNN